MEPSPSLCIPLLHGSPVIITSHMSPLYKPLPFKPPSNPTSSNPNFHSQTDQKPQIKAAPISFLVEQKWLRQCQSFSKGSQHQHQPSSPSFPTPSVLLLYLPSFLGHSTPTAKSPATIRMKAQSPSVAAPPTGLPPAAVTSVLPSSQVVVICVLFPFPTSKMVPFVDQIFEILIWVWFSMTYLDWVFVLVRYLNWVLFVL